MNISIGKRVKVVHPHSGEEHRNFMFYPGGWRHNEHVVYLDAIGRRGATTYAWLPLICAIGMGCQARVLVRRDLLEEIADAALKTGISL